MAKTKPAPPRFEVLAATLAADGSLLTAGMVVLGERLLNDVGLELRRGAVRRTRKEPSDG